MKALSIIYILLACTSLSVAQHGGVEVFYDKDHELAYYKYEVKSKETMYRLSKTYGCSVEDIVHINKMKTSGLSLGQTLVIPFKNEIIQYHKPILSTDNSTPVYYTVQRKETAFRIARSYFKVNLTAIKELNELKRNSLKIGQRLIIGYIKNHVKPAEAAQVEEAVALERIETPPIEIISAPDLAVEPLPAVPIDDRVFSINYENGAAFWNKEAAGLNGYFVLHRYAERNTWIEVTNPMFQTSVQAKVIGNIPDTGYPSDVLIVVSPSIAKDLGALDARFYVKVRYLRAESRLTKGK